MNKTDSETDVNNVGDDNDTNNIAQEHKASNADSPGQAAKKARLRAAMKNIGIKTKPPVAILPDETSALPRNRANPSGAFEANVGGTVRQAAKLFEPDAAGAQSVDPMASIKGAMRGAQQIGDSATLKRFVEHLKTFRKP